MKKRHKYERVYTTHNLFVYLTKNKTYAVEGVILGKRIRKRTKCLQDAKAVCHSIEEGWQKQRFVSTSLTNHQVVEAEHVFSRLPDGVTLTQITDYFLSNHQISKIKLRDAVDEYLGTKEDLSINTYKQAKVLLNAFARSFESQELATVNRTDINSYLRKVNAPSHNHHLRAIKGLFRWADLEGYCQVNPCISIKPIKSLKPEVAVLSSEEVKALLEASRTLYGGKLLPYVAITIYAGLRPDSEMRHLTWDKINLKDGEIRVTRGKTNTPRLVEMPACLIALLQQCDFSQPIYPTNFRRIWGEVRRAAGFKSGLSGKAGVDKNRKPWIKDIMRHTAISYRIRATGDIFTTATWAGNSPEIIKRHYLGLVTQSEQKMFFG